MECLNRECIEGCRPRRSGPVSVVNIPGTLTPQGYQRLRGKDPDGYRVRGLQPVS
jgi:hypothetical protein